MPTRGNDGGVERLLGALEEGVRAITKSVERIEARAERQQEASTHYRQQVSDQLKAIDGKIDPVITDISALKFTVQAHEVVLKSYETMGHQLTGAGRMGRWIVRGGWTVACALAVAYADHVKAPLHGFWKLLGK